jgi:hypothetical protein
MPALLSVENFVQAFLFLSKQIALTIALLFVEMFDQKFLFLFVFWIFLFL